MADNAPALRTELYPDIEPYDAGMLPVGIFGGGDQLEVIQGDAYYQSYICRIPRSTIELGLTGRLNALDGMLFPSTCDVIRNLSGMWQMLFPTKLVRYLDVPQNFDPAIGGRFYRHELEELAASLTAVWVHGPAAAAVTARAQTGEEPRASASTKRTRQIATGSMTMSTSWSITLRTWAMVSPSRSSTMAFFQPGRVPLKRPRRLGLACTLTMFTPTTFSLIHATDFASGWVKPFFFGFGIAIVGCLEGMTCGQGTEGVGRATTRTVVTSSLAILGLDFVLTAFMFKGI